MKNILYFLLSIMMLSLTSCSSNEPTNTNTKSNWIVYVTTHYERLPNLSNYTVKEGNCLDSTPLPNDSLTFNSKSYDQYYFNESSTHIDKTIVDYFLQYYINEPVNVKDTIVYFSNITGWTKAYYVNRIRTYIKSSSTSNDPKFHWKFSQTTSWNAIPFQEGQSLGYPRSESINNVTEFCTGSLEFKLLTEAEANAKISFLSVPDVLTYKFFNNIKVTITKSYKVTGSKF